MKEKSFITLTTGVNVIRLLFIVNVALGIYSGVTVYCLQVKGGLPSKASFWPCQQTLDKAVIVYQGQTLKLFS
jgi:hypothetical protein